MQLSEREILDKARILLSKVCKVCRFCDGKECISGVPGMGGVGYGFTFRRNVEAFRKVYIEPVYIQEERYVPNTDVEVFGKRFSMPIGIAPFTGAESNLRGAVKEEDIYRSYMMGASLSGAIPVFADGGKEERFDLLMSIVKEYTYPFGIILKPRSDVSMLIDRIGIAFQNGAFFVGIDIDGWMLRTTKKYKNISFMTFDSLYKVISEIPDVPFVLKGVFSLSDFSSAVDIGVSAIWISNHGGRILDSMKSSFEVLFDVMDYDAGALSRISHIFFDGGIRSGEDVFKALSFGADVVFLGRLPIIYAVGGGYEGINLLFSRLKDELSDVMRVCSLKDIEDVMKRGEDFCLYYEE
jgi:isopentenyl diphosphate isomerase/L-lactate dehydrogenase-like FMN-dependent dehydrogenase